MCSAICALTAVNASTQPRRRRSVVVGAPDDAEVVEQGRPDATAGRRCRCAASRLRLPGVEPADAGAEGDLVEHPLHLHGGVGDPARAGRRPPRSRRRSRREPSAPRRGRRRAPAGHRGLRRAPPGAGQRMVRRHGDVVDGDSGERGRGDVRPTPRPVRGRCRRRSPPCAPDRGCAATSARRHARPRRDRVPCKAAIARITAGSLPWQ